MSDLRKAAEMALYVLRNTEGLCDQTRKQVANTKDALNYALSEHKPVAWFYNGILHEFDPSEFATSTVTPLYTAPPTRKWVGLTNKEILKIKNDNVDMKFNKICFAIEKKLQEKNT